MKSIFPVGLNTLDASRRLDLLLALKDESIESPFINECILNRDYCTDFILNHKREVERGIQSIVISAEMQLKEELEEACADRKRLEEELIHCQQALTTTLEDGVTMEEKANELEAMVVEIMPQVERLAPLEEELMDLKQQFGAS